MVRLPDAVHELIGWELEIAYQQGYRAALESCHGDARQLRHLVERLMEQVRSQSPTHDEAAQPIDVAALLTECADTVAPLAGDVPRVPAFRRHARPARRRAT